MPLIQMSRAAPCMRAALAGCWLALAATRAESAATPSLSAEPQAIACSQAALRDAMARGGEFVVDCGTRRQTIVWTGEAVEVRSAVSLRLRRPGTLLVQSGNRLARVAADGTLSLEGIDFEAPERGDGQTPGVLIANEGTLSIQDARLRGYTMAVHNRMGRVSVDRVVFERNQSGIYSEGGSVNVRRAVFRGNLAAAGSVMSPLAVLGAYVNVAESSFTDNKGGLFAGAIHHIGEAPLSIVNSTFVNNESGGAAGAAVYLEGRGTPPSISFSTFSGNQPAAVSGPFEMTNSIVVGPVSHGPCRISGESNIGWPHTQPNDCGTALRFADPVLLPLGYNGGPTPTMMPGTNSPALNASSGKCPALDQRGLPRFAYRPGAVCDVGSVERSFKGLGASPLRRYLALYPRLNADAAASPP